MAVCLLFAVAVGARTIGIGLFVTPDEDNWMRRSGNFARGLATWRLERTYQSGHPGVLTMWLTTLALGSETTRLAGTTTSDPDSSVTRVPGFMALLARARLAFVLLNSALVVAITLLVWRLVGAAPAALAGPLLAFDPFYVAHTQVVHLDGLSGGLMTVAVLSAAIFWWGQGNVGFLVLCGISTGLAVLTKAPSLFLGVAIPAIAVGAKIWRPDRFTCLRAAVSVAACGALALGVIFLLWPALWVAPIETLARAIEFTREQAGQPHVPGNYFRGQATPDPGYLFYPVAIAFRLAPPVLVGLVALAVLLPPRSSRWQTLVLLDVALGFLVFLTLASKKLDRYAIPLFPMLSILGAVGIWTVWLHVRPKAPAAWFAGLVALVALAQALPLLAVRPYALAYYNPLLGGGVAAQRVLLVGWGEGLDQVAAYLNAQPGADSSRIAIYYPLMRNFQGMVEGTVQRFGQSEPADYVVDYVNAHQRRQTPREVAGLEPSLVVEINGIDYARVYRLVPPRPIPNP